MRVFEADRRVRRVPPAAGRTALALSVWWAYDWTVDRFADSIAAKARKP